MDMHRSSDRTKKKSVWFKSNKTIFIGCKVPGTSTRVSSKRRFVSHPFSYIFSTTLRLLTLSPLNVENLQSNSWRWSEMDKFEPFSVKAHRDERWLEVYRDAAEAFCCSCQRVRVCSANGKRSTVLRRKGRKERGGEEILFSVRQEYRERWRRGMRDLSVKVREKIALFFSYFWTELRYPYMVASSNWGIFEPSDWIEGKFEDSLHDQTTP